MRVWSWIAGIAIVVLFAVDTSATPCSTSANFCMDCTQGFANGRNGIDYSHMLASCCMADSQCKCFGIAEVMKFEEDVGWGCVIEQIDQEEFCRSTDDDKGCPIGDDD